MPDPDRSEGGAPPQDGSHQHQPIVIVLDDDIIDDPQSEVGARAQDLLNRARRCDALLPGARPIKAEEEDDENVSEDDPWAEEEANYDKENAAIEAIDLTEEDDDDQQPEPETGPVPGRAGRMTPGYGHCRHWRKGVRNPCRCGTHYRSEHATTAGGLTLKPMQFVELREPVEVGRYQAEFLEVTQIYYRKNAMLNKGHHDFVRGVPYARTRNLDGRVEPRKNEVCALLEVDSNDDRPVDVQALVEVPLDGIKAARVLHKTNKPFPECRFDPVRYQTRADREARAPLTCRWVMTRTFPDARYRRRGRAVDGEELRHYGEADVVKDRHRASDHDRLTKWRRDHEKIPGGFYIPDREYNNTKAEPTPEASSSTKIHPGQKYSVVDFFCGAGGFSKGVEMAGFKVLTACDHWSRCCETYRENLPGVDLHEKDAFAFIQEHGSSVSRSSNNNTTTDLTVDPPAPVDLVHMSPPCQFYSPAHTCPGKNDTANIATLFSCEHVVLIYRPRLFTVEQTFGLSQDRHSSYFNAFIQGFTRHGYSVKWKVLRLVDFGLPQTRRRLFMMGAAPGEALPAWPRPTHARDPAPGQKPCVSAVQACRPLVPGVNHHDVQASRVIDRAPWDGERPLERTITTSGGQCYHWSGERDLTLAEFAALQGFPSDFRFRSSYIKKQIGNAFPPVVVKAIMKQIRKHLEDVDGVQRLPEPSTVIDLDADDDGDHKSVNWLKGEDSTYRDTMGTYDRNHAIAAAINESKMNSRSHFTRTSQNSTTLHHRDFRSLSINDDLKTATQTNTVPTAHNSNQPAPADRRRSSAANSITYMGESTRPGSSRNLPVIVEDCEVETQAGADGAPSSRSISLALPQAHPSASRRNQYMTYPPLLRKDAFARASSAILGASVARREDHAVAGPSPRRVTFAGYGERRCNERDMKMWREYVGDLYEEVATSLVIHISRYGVKLRVGSQGATNLGSNTSSAEDPIDRMGKGNAKAFEESGSAVDGGQPQVFTSLSLENQAQELNQPKGKQKEDARIFEQFDDGQDNESPKGKHGGPKRSCIG